jgi:hypothetical protein
MLRLLPLHLSVLPLCRPLRQLLRSNLRLLHNLVLTRPRRARPSVVAKPLLVPLPTHRAAPPAQGSVKCLRLSGMRQSTFTRVASRLLSASPRLSTSIASLPLTSPATVDPGDIGRRSHTCESRYLRVCESYHACIVPLCIPMAPLLRHRLCISLGAAQGEGACRFPSLHLAATPRVCALYRL